MTELNLSHLTLPTPERRVYCNRTLNLRSIRAIGFDMDYTLIHYKSAEWELQAYAHMQRRLAQKGWPVEHLSFDSELVSLGIILDIEHGNLVKANRFGFVKKAVHGTRVMGFDEVRALYAQEIIDLSMPRWVFIHTLFGLSEACMYAQAVDLIDEGKLPPALGYQELYPKIRASLDEAHMEGQLKAHVIAEPERYVELDPELPLALLDLKHAGKRLMLITNSEWHYANAMMAYAFDAFLPGEMTWRDLFDLTIVRSMKPGFFTGAFPFLELVDEAREHLVIAQNQLKLGGVYVGGNAPAVERFLGLSGEQILYVGDHIYADVHVSKDLMRWRTALVLRDLEKEIVSLSAFAEAQVALDALMEEKELLEHRFSVARLTLQRIEKGYGPELSVTPSARDLRDTMQQLRARLVELDAEVEPLVREATTLVHPLWGLLLRAGNDKSHLARQIERSADVYMSRVSNLLSQTPFVYLRAPRGSLPHDPIAGAHAGPDSHVDGWC